MVVNPPVPSLLVDSSSHSDNTQCRLWIFYGHCDIVDLRITWTHYRAVGWPYPHSMWDMECGPLRPERGIFQVNMVCCIPADFWSLSQYRYSLSGNRIPIIEIRRSWDRLIFIMRIPIMVKQHLHTETPPGSSGDGEYCSFINDMISFLWFQHMIRSDYNPASIPFDCLAQKVHFLLCKHWALKARTEHFSPVNGTGGH